MLIASIVVGYVCVALLWAQASRMMAARLRRYRECRKPLDSVLIGAFWPIPLTFLVLLAAWFIRSHCPPSGLVLDPFGGSRDVEYIFDDDTRRTGVVVVGGFRKVGTFEIITEDVR